MFTRHFLCGTFTFFILIMHPLPQIHTHRVCGWLCVYVLVQISIQMYTLYLIILHILYIHLGLDYTYASISKLYFRRCCMFLCNLSNYLTLKLSKVSSISFLVCIDISWYRLPFLSWQRTFIFAALQLQHPSLSVWKVVSLFHLWSEDWLQ